VPRSITTEPKVTRRRRAKLEAYFAENVLDGKRFVCTSCPTCRASALRRPGTSFRKGQLSYLGEHYDTSEDGVPLRILVIPMETGRQRQKVSMTERAPEIRKRIAGGRNPHMAGTALALRLAFGQPLGADRAAETIAIDPPVHVFEAYAMANLLLCSAVEMRAACVRHLAATIRILEPTLVISQGESLKKELTRLFAPQWKRGELPLAEGRLDGCRFAWASLHHPSRHWHGQDMKYFVETAAPTISRARVLARRLYRD
jgi:hypothetical protein